MNKRFKLKWISLKLVEPMYEIVLSWLEPELVLKDFQLGSWPFSLKLEIENQPKTSWNFYFDLPARLGLAQNLHKSSLNYFPLRNFVKNNWKLKKLGPLSINVSTFNTDITDKGLVFFWFPIFFSSKFCRVRNPFMKKTHSFVYDISDHCLPGQNGTWVKF